MYIFQILVGTWLSAPCSTIAFGAFLQRRVGPPTLSQPHKHLDSCSIPGFVDIRNKLCYARVFDKVLILTCMSRTLAVGQGGVAWAGGSGR